jgi:hypothetical protein
MRRTCRANGGANGQNDPRVSTLAFHGNVFSRMTLIGRTHMPRVALRYTQSVAAVCWQQAASKGSLETSGDDLREWTTAD